MIPVTANWRPHSEAPTEIPITAVIAVRDEEGETHLLSSVHTFTVHRSAWVDEISGNQVAEQEFWWLPEEELLAALPKVSA